MLLTVSYCYHRCSSPSSSTQHTYTTTTHCLPPHPPATTASQNSSSTRPLLLLLLLLLPRSKCVKRGGGRHWKHPHSGAKHFIRCRHRGLLLLVMKVQGRHWRQHIHWGRGVVLLLPSLLLTGH